MSTRKMLAAAAVAGMVAGGSVAIAEMRHRGEGSPRHGGLRAVLADLDLSPEQKAEIREVLEVERPLLEPLRERVGLARRGLARAVHAAPLDEAAVRNAADALGRAMADHAVGKARMLSRIREVLGPEQREILDRRHERRARRIERRSFER